ncbi:MAG: DUF4190 domain-containing protein [Actinomycetota bacterium]
MNAPDFSRGARAAHSWGQPPPPPPGQQPPPGGPAMQPYSAPQQYPPPQQYGGGGGQTDGTAIASLVLAIGSFVVFPIILAIIALVLASSAKKKIAASGGTLGGEGLAKAATIVSWINLAFGIVAILFLVVAVIAVAPNVRGGL